MIIESEEQVTEAVLKETARIEDARSRQIIGSLIRHLHAFVREVGLTEQEFDQAITLVTALGQSTTESHNETRLMAGSLGVSILVSLTNNHGTSANLLGPFWRAGAPYVEDGGTLVRSPTPGLPLFFTGRVIDTRGAAITGATVDVWQASPQGLYENQDPTQADWNLRGRLLTDHEGTFRFRSVKPAGYPIPMHGPVGRLLTTEHRHPFRPAHLHALIYKPGFKTIATQVYSDDDPLIETDAQFGVVRHLLGHYVRHEGPPAPAPELQGPWCSLEYTFVLQPGEMWLPTPPVSAKAQTAIGTVARS